MKLSEELKWRGFVNQTTFKSPAELDRGKITFYWGVDPSASSMQIGNLASAMMVRHFLEHGHKAVLLIGGATGLIGDPDGKSEERTLKSVEEVSKYKENIVAQYKQIFAGQDFEIVDNYDWFKGLGYLQFLRDVGKHVPMRQMLSRDFVQKRLSEDGAGISYAEFSYVLIQGYDFLHLFRNKGVTLQVCGSDQWGNSIAGVELIRRLEGKEAHVWSTPLIIDKSTGRKFGKSEGDAVWLDTKLTSVYRFYQFWLNTDDDGVGDYIRVYTMLSKDEVGKVMDEFNQDKASRLAQKTLAYEVTKIVHGKEVADSIVRATETLFGGKDYSLLKETDLEKLKDELPCAGIKIGEDLVEALVATGLASSKGEARRFLLQGAVYLNGQQIPADKTITASDRLAGSYAVLRRGKNSNSILIIS